MKAFKTRLLVAVTALSIAQTTGATSASCVIPLFSESAMLNVSSAGWSSQAEPLIACTVINPDMGAQGFAFLSETTTEDAVLEIKYVDKPFPQRIADNWKTDLSAAQQQKLPNNLRVPARDTDAALVLHIDPTYYDPPLFNHANSASRRYGVCAYGYPKSGRAWTSVSISTLRMVTCAGDWNLAPALYFER
ncbi:hypothetical protein LJR038_001334 [Acidovorax sp. LjRoot38]|uniref:hypothetical protein n=1 Tax=Acidovorax sp. LjRoot38 TaxID=3342327 RepID=UPI003ECEC75E